jgi:hypothetical protein
VLDVVPVQLDDERFPAGKWPCRRMATSAVAARAVDR